MFFTSEMGIGSLGTFFFSFSFSKLDAGLMSLTQLVTSSDALVPTSFLLLLVRHLLLYTSVALVSASCSGETTAIYFVVSPEQRPDSRAVVSHVQSCAGRPHVSHIAYIAATKK